MSHEEWLLGLKVRLQGDKAGQETSLLLAEVTAHVKITALALCNVWAHLGPFIRSPERYPVATVGRQRSGPPGGAAPVLLELTIHRDQWEKLQETNDNQRKNWLAAT